MEPRVGERPAGAVRDEDEVMLVLIREAGDFGLRKLLGFED